MQDYPLILIGIAIIMLGLLLIKRAASKSFDIFDPYYITWLTYLLVFVVAPMVWVVRGKKMAFGYEVMDGLPYASFLFLLGFIVFSLVNIYLCNKDEFSSRRSFSKRIALKDTIDRRAYGNRIVSYAQIGLLAVTVVYAYSLYLKGVSIISLITFQMVDSELVVQNDSVLVDLLSKSCIAYVPLLMILYVYQKRLRPVLYLEAALVLLLYISRGYRYIILVLVFSPIVLNYLIKKKRPSLSKLITALIAVFLIVALVGVTRDSLRTGAALEAFTFDDMLDSILVNIEVFFPYYREVLVVPEGFPYANGVSFAYIVFMFIPRSIWPTKPFAPYGMLARYMFGYSASTGMAYVHIGEFYLNFGPVGVIVCMGIFGAILAYMKRLYTMNDSIRSLIVYSMLFTFLIQYLTRGDFTSILVQLFFLFVPLFLVFHLCRRLRISEREVGVNYDKRRHKIKT